jgi:uncharacterized damage-inducible protein DinB
MSVIERFRHWYEQECDSNEKMLRMVESVPTENLEDPRFSRALTLVAHLAACRQNWLDRMTNEGKNQAAWWEEGVALENLRPRYAAVEESWRACLASLNDESLDQDFEFPTRDGKRFRWSIEGQIVQLVGHSFYHRGQIALLVDQLGGETVDTDYLYWEFEQNPRYGAF